MAENHSITKTSLEFYTTHQSVSKIIRQLEEEMEAQLFVRSSKGMTLTPEGEVLIPFEEDLTLDIMLATNAQPALDDVSRAFVELARENAPETIS